MPVRCPEWNREEFQMVAPELEKEQLALLPPRLETARFMFTRNNIAVVVQSNTVTQTMDGCHIGCVQVAVPVNVSVVIQIQ
jgi:hypothetical protein